MTSLILLVVVVGASIAYWFHHSSLSARNVANNIDFSGREDLRIGPYRVDMSLQSKGGYSSDGKKEGKVIFAIAAICFVRSLFVSVDIKTATVCPSGLNAERTLAKFQAYDPGYHCLPGDELLKQFFTSRWVFPGDPEFDENWLKVELRGLRKADTPKILN